MNASNEKVLGYKQISLENPGNNAQDNQQPQISRKASKSFSNKQAPGERFLVRLKEKKRTQQKKTTKLQHQLYGSNQSQDISAQSDGVHPTIEIIKAPQQPHGGGMTQKLLVKHQNILEKQKKLMEGLMQKNQENQGKDSQINQNGENQLQKRKTLFTFNANNNNNIPRTSINVGTDQHERRSKLINQNFISTLKQKIQQVQEQEKKSFHHRLKVGFNKCKISTMNFMLSTSVQVLMGLATIFTLYCEDFRQVFISSSHDLSFQILELVILIFFFIEIIILSICKRGYFLRFNFWMDIISTVSMLFDIDFLTKAIFGLSFNYNQVSVLKASRVSRIATRATKLVRFIRLLRLTKLQMLYKKAYENLHKLYVQKEELSESSEPSIDDKPIPSNFSSQQILENERVNHSYQGHSEFQIKNLENKINSNNESNENQKQVHRRMNSFDKNSISVNSAMKNMYRRRSFDLRDNKEKLSPKNDLNNNNNNRNSVRLASKKGSNQQIESGELSNQNLTTPKNNMPTSNQKIDLYRKSVLSHVSQYTSTSHEPQQQMQLRNLVAGNKMSRLSINPHSQNPLKSISFVNPGMDTPKQRQLSETDINNSDSKSSFGSQSSFGFEDEELLEEDEKESEKVDLNKKRMNDESKIGQQLADRTINRVILLIFILVVCIPFFDDSNYLQTDQGFDTFITFLSQQYDDQDTLYPLFLNILVTQGIQYDNSDVMHRYPLSSFTAANQAIYPSQTYPEKNYFSDLRSDEQLEFSSTSSRDGSSFDALYIIKLDQDLTSYLQIGQTTFIMVLLAYSIIVFVRDISRLVVSPIERMLQNIKLIADNPLQAAKMSEEKAMAEQEMKKNRVQYLELAEKQGDETYLLESTIMKIGALLAIGFGEAGSKIITKNMQKGGRIDPMIPGKKVMAIFGFCSIKNFSDATEILQEKVMIFANEIAELVHICCDSFHGAINKNLGDCFLLVWKFTEDESQLFIDEYDEVRMKNLPLVQNLSDLPVIAFLKAIANSRLLSLTPNFIQQHLLPLQKSIPTFKLRLGFGLHVGWGIEGAIGSNFKIDASYLSPNVNLASRLENATKQYGLYLLLSGSLYRLLSTKVQHSLRHIDRVTVKGSKQPMDLYTCDVDPTLLRDGKYIKKRPQDENVNKKVLKFISRKRRTERYKKIIKGQSHICQILDSDADIFTMRQNYTEDFRETYHEGLQEYFDGDWAYAKEIFEDAQLILKDNLYRAGEDENFQDGPIQNLLHFMQKYNYKSPPNWFGYRILHDK